MSSACHVCVMCDVSCVIDVSSMRQVCVMRVCASSVQCESCVKSWCDVCVCVHVRDVTQPPLSNSKKE